MAISRLLALRYLAWYEPRGCLRIFLTYSPQGSLERRTPAKSGSWSIRNADAFVIWWQCSLSTRLDRAGLRQEESTLFTREKSTKEIGWRQCMTILSRLLINSLDNNQRCFSKIETLKLRTQSLKANPHQTGASLGGGVLYTRDLTVPSNFLPVRELLNSSFRSSFQI